MKKLVAAQREQNGCRLLAFALSLLILGTGCSTPKGCRYLKSLGLDYRLQEVRDPRPNRIHILRVDLTSPAIRPEVEIGADPDGEGPAETELTDPFKLAADPSVLAFVNTNPWESLVDDTGKRNRNWFEGQPVDIRGLAVSRGDIRSSSRDYSASIWFKESGCAHIGEAPAIELAGEVMTGFQPVVREGVVAVDPSEVRHPRTAIGSNRDGTLLWLVVVDGRQPQYSEGMSLCELGEIMLEIGCWNAVNMDGGGSSIMGLLGPEGRLQVVNSPSGRFLGGVKLRPLPTILTIKANPEIR